MRGKNAAAALAVALSMLMLAAPMGQAQGIGLQNPNKSTPTSLYFHIFDVFNAFPINTQKPNTDFFEVGGTNFPTIVEPSSGTNYDFNTMYGYSTSGPVEYGFIENGQPRFHPERGIAADVKIDDTAPAFVYIYVSVRDVLGTDNAPNFMPAYTFRFEMREKNDLNEANLESGQLIMSGQQTLHLASSHFADLNGTLGPDGYPIVTPNADGVIEYRIPLTIASKVIPKKEGFHVRIDWYQNPGNQPDQHDRAAEGYMRLVSQAGYHPRLEFSIMNPVYIDFIHPQVAAGILLIHTAENSPWGTYDIDVANITVAIKNAAGNPVNANLQQVTSQNAHVHNLHDKSAEVTYLWRFREEGVPDGKYTITIGVQNLAKTATATGTAEFVLEGKQVYGVAQDGSIVTAAPEVESESESSPGAGLLVILVALGAAIAVRRRGA